MATKRTGGGSGVPSLGGRGDDVREDAESTRIDQSGAIGGPSRTGRRGAGDSTEALEIDIDMASEPPPPPQIGGAADQAYKLPQPLGRYTLTKLLGVGGMAEVFLAEQAGVAGFKKTCVVKRMLRHLSIEPRFVEMFLREAHLASTLHHANIVQIWDLGEADGSYFIAMEYVDGLPLNLLARTAWRAGRSLPTEVVCCALADAAEGLAAAHERIDEHGAQSPIIHRDISPDNLMIGRDGVTKILDFGIARIGTGERTSTGELKGKVPFMAPEMLRGKALDGRVDVYSLGVTAYWLLTGKRPFTGATDLLIMQSILADTPREPIALNAGVPPELNQLVMRMLEKDPSRRISSAREVARALDDVLVARRTIVMPFVRTIFDIPQHANPDEPISQTSGFLPSTPHTDTLKMGRVLLHAPLGPHDERMALEVSASAPRRLPPTAQELATVGRSSSAPHGEGLMQALDDATAGELALSTSEALAPQTEEAPLEPQPTGPWPQPPDPLASLADAAFADAAPARGIPRPVILGVAAGLACVVVVAAIVMSRSPEPSEPMSADAGALIADATTPPHRPTGTDSEAEAAVDAGGPPEELATADAGAPQVVVDEPPPRGNEPSDNTRQRTRNKREPPAKQSVTVKGPPEVQWLAEGRGVGSGSGTVQVPAGATKLVAWDKKRGVKTTVPIAAGAVDYGKLPRGKLQPRVKPFAEVFLGQVSIGTTPFAAVDVVAGTYTVRFVYKDKEQVKSVEVTAGAVVRPLVDFTASP